MGSKDRQLAKLTLGCWALGKETIMRYLKPLCAGVTAVLFSAGASHADFGDQLFKLLGSDGGAGDTFGISVAIGGPVGQETAIVGARLWDELYGQDQGSAYLFDVKDGQEIFQLLPDDGGGYFGFSVAIGGGNAIVGAMVASPFPGANAAGAVYLFDTATGQQLFRFLADDREAGDHFGYSVAMSGNTLIIGAQGDDTEAGQDAGSAYLFDIPSRKQLAKLEPDDALEQDEFGPSVAISGVTAIVGAWKTDDNGNESGAAYLFDVTDPSNPVQIAKLLADDGAERDHFGASVAIFGTTALVGADDDDDNGFQSGSAYLFDTITGQQMAKLLPDDGGEDFHFGSSVAIGNTFAIIGASQDGENGENAGAAYLFDVTDPSDPVQVAKLLANDGAVGDAFGVSVAIRVETAIIGALRDDDIGYDAGSAYLFDAVVVPGKCPWDLDDSGAVATSDLILLLGSWGDPYGTEDLIELLGNWGPCP